VRLSIGSNERHWQPRAQIGCSACITQRSLRANGLYPNDRILPPLLRRALESRRIQGPLLIWCVDRDQIP